MMVHYVERVLTDKENLEWERHIAEVKRRDKAVIEGLVRAVREDDAQLLVDCIQQLDTLVLFGWKRAFRRLARLRNVSEDTQWRMLTLWRHSGDHIRGEVGDDLLLADALRVLLPSYTGPAVTLFRGDSGWNRRRRTYGLAWSAQEDVGDHFAQKWEWRSCEGGSVLLRAEAPPEAIICAPALLDDGHGEAEYLVDRRRLRVVSVVRRYAQVAPYP